MLVPILNAQDATAPAEPEKPELVLQTGQTSPAQTIAFSADGKLLASGGWAELAVRVWETSTGRQLALLTRRSSIGDALFSGVTALAFSRDGMLLAAGFGDNGVAIWAVRSGDEVAAMPGSSSGFGVKGILFAPDGQRLLTLHDDGSRVWDLSTGALVREITTRKYSLCKTATFATNGRQVVTLGPIGGSANIVRRNDGAAAGTISTVTFTDIASGTETRTADVPGSLAAMAMGTCVLTTPQDHVLVATGDSNQFQLRDVSSGAAPRIVSQPIPNSDPISLAIQTLSSDGRFAAFAQHSRLYVWDLNTSQLLFTKAIETNPLIEMANEIMALEFSADGKFLAAGSSDGRIRMFDSLSGQLARRLEGTVTPSREVAFDSRRGYLYSGQNTAWNLTSGRGEQILAGVPGTRGVLSPDGTMVAETSASSGDVRILNISTGGQISTLASGVSAGVNEVVFSRSGRLAAVTYKVDLATKGAQSRAPVAAPALQSLRLPEQKSKGKKQSTGDLMARLQERVQAIQAAAIAAQSADPAAQVRIFEVASGRQIAAIPALASVGADLRDFDICPDEQSLAVATQAGIEIWTIADQHKRMTLAPPADSGTGISIPVLSGYARRIQSLHYSPNGKFLAASLRDSSASMAAATQATARGFSSITSQKHRTGLGSLFPQLSMGGKPSLGSANSSGTNAFKFRTEGPVEIWDTTKGERILTLPGHANGTGALAYSPGGELLATTGVDDDIKIWDLTTGKELKTLTAQTAMVNDLAFDASSTLLATASADGTTRLWDLKTGEPLAILLSLYDGKDWLVVTPDGLFDGSPGAWSQILWRFGGTIFDVSPVESFFVEYYYPDLLADLVAGKRPHATQDIAKKDRRQPHLTVAAVGVTPGDAVATRALTVTVTVDAAPAGAHDVRLFQNGSLVKAWRGDVLKGQTSVTLQTSVSLVAGENAFTVYAFNADNIKSADDRLVVNGDMKLARKGTAHVLAIGINKYKNADYDLAYAVADAREFANELRSQQSRVGSFSRIDVTLLLDQDATKANILLALDRLAGRGVLPPNPPAGLAEIKSAEPEDAVFIYFAGHGTARGQHFFFIPHDLEYQGRRKELQETDLDAILAHSISDEDLEPVLEGIVAGHMILVVDACHSGQALESEEKRRGPINASGLAQLAYEKGMYILTAAQGYQAAAEVSKLGHGLLTYALVEEGMKTAAADRAPKDGQITVREWFDYSAQRVPELQMLAMEEAHKAGRELIMLDNDDASSKVEKRMLQHPRAYYRREPETHPFIISTVEASP